MARTAAKVKEYRNFLSDARRVAYVDVSLVFSAIPISVILFDESCKTVDSKTICGPAVSDNLLLASIVILVFSFVVSKTLFPEKNYYLFYSAHSNIPVFINFLTVLSLVSIVWFAVQNASVFIATIVHAISWAGFAYFSFPSLHKICSKGGSVLVYGLILIFINFVAFGCIYVLVSLDFDPVSHTKTSTAAILLLIAAYIFVHSWIYNRLCRGLNGM